MSGKTDTIDRLSKRIVELEKDEERLDWLDAPGFVRVAEIRVNCMNEHAPPVCFFAGHDTSGAHDTLRKAIDAAIRKAKGISDE